MVTVVGTPLSRGIYEMGISDADTAKNPGYFRFVCKKTAHFANAWSRPFTLEISAVRRVWCLTWVEVWRGKA